MLAYLVFHIKPCLFRNKQNQFRTCISFSFPHCISEFFYPFPKFFLQKDIHKIQMIKDLNIIDRVPAWGYLKRF